MRSGKQKDPSRGKRRRGKIVVGVVCNQRGERESLVYALRAVGGVEAIDCGAGTVDSIARVRDLAIELVLIAMDPGPGASFAASLRSGTLRARPVALLRSESEGALTRLAAAGVLGFIQVESDLIACIRALRAVHRHGFYCPPALAALVVHAKASRPQAVQRSSGTPIGRLHGRRLEVAECIANGLSNKEICRRLGIAEGTVKNHVHAVLSALSVEHRWEVASALRQGGFPLGLVQPRNGEEGT